MGPSKLTLGERLPVFLIILSFVEFDYLNMLGLGSFMSLLRMVAAVLALAVFVFRQARIDAHLVLWLTLPIWILLSTMLAESNVSGAVGFLMRISTVALFFYSYRDHFVEVLHILYVVLGVLVLANLVSILAFPEGMYVTGTTNLAYENWLLGFKNKHIVFFLPLLLITLLLCELEGIGVDKIAVIAAIVVSPLLTGSSTTLVSMSVMVVLGVLPFFRRKYRVFNSSTYFVLVAVLFIAVVLLRLQEIFSFLIVDVLGKDLTLTNRTVLWDIAMREIARRPIIGWGIQNNDYLHFLYSSHSIISAHNQILEYTFQGGVIAFIIYFGINLCIARNLDRTASEPCTQIACAAFLAMHIALLTEVYADPLFYLLYFIIWFAPGLTVAVDCVAREGSSGAGCINFGHSSRV